MLQYGYSLDSVFLVVLMQLNSKTYITVVLSGIAAICMICLLLRWQYFAQQQDSPQLGLKRGPVHFSKAAAGSVERHHSDPAGQSSDDNPAVKAQASQPDAPDSSTDGTAARQSAGTGIDINTAGIKELQSLPGIGPVLASRICAYRQTHGAFESIEELAAVEGIGAAKLDSLRPLIRIEKQP
jgi:competence ComEA-like helix-hairpin-helix protein